jgi:hypothetical protein
VGNAAKAGVRFVSYDHFKSMLSDAEVRLSSLLVFSFSDLFGFIGNLRFMRVLLGL